MGHSGLFILIFDAISQKTIHKIKAQLTSDYFQTVSIPVVYKEIRDVVGTCFFLMTEETATTEKKYQGWRIEMSPHQEWEVYLGISGLYHPTHSAEVSLDSFTLQPNTETFITFTGERAVTLPRRGYFQATTLYISRKSQESITF